jgi:hypothetical protein
VKRDSNSFLFICERKLSRAITFVLVLAGADRGGSLVAPVWPPLAVRVVPADSGVLTSPLSVSSSSSDDGSGSVDQAGHSNECQLKYTN